MRQGITAGWACLILFGLAACGDGRDSADQTAHMSLSIMDAPVDTVSSLVLQIRGVVVTRQEDLQEFRYEFPMPRQINLLEYQGQRSAKLLDMELPPGKYRSVRLLVDHEAHVRDSYVVSLSGEECELQIPSDVQSPWTVISPFDLTRNASTSLTLDVDLHRSILGSNCAAGYVFQPALSLLNDSFSGWIAGEIDAALLTDNCLPKVYVFFSNQVADDLEAAQPPEDTDPKVIARATIENGVTAYRYHTPRLLQTGDPANVIGFCSLGQVCPVKLSYLLAFTCDDDDPVQDNAITFLSQRIADVEPNITTIVNFGL